MVADIVYCNDRYKVIYQSHIIDARLAREWCWDNWGSNWGEIRFGSLNQKGIGEHEFFFRLMSHAVWFKLKFHS